MAESERTRVIAAAPADVWAVLADFGAVSSWIESADHSCILVQQAQPVDTSRRVQMGRNTLVETITEFDPPRHIAYDVTGLPALVRRMNTAWTLRGLNDGRTHVTLVATIEIGSDPVRRLAERVMCRGVARQYAAILDDLAHRMENHHDSP